MNKFCDTINKTTKMTKSCKTLDDVSVKLRCIEFFTFSRSFLYRRNECTDVCDLQFLQTLAPERLSLSLALSVALEGLVHLLVITLPAPGAVLIPVLQL